MRGKPPEFFYLSKVPSSAANEAFEFHQRIASGDERIWPRTIREICEYAQSGLLFGVRLGQSGPFVALCYVALGPEEREFEFGGLTVIDSYRKLGIGTILASFALAHAMVYERPWQYNQHVIAHVHEANNDPRRLLARLGFEFISKVEIPGDTAPPSMKRNAEGKVVGDKFRFTYEGLRRLSAWFDKEFNGTLLGGAEVMIDLGHATLDELKQSLRDLVASLPA